ncbi:MAG TPA: HAMP domain-containing protein, partial [Thermoanaerobaculia bacterium]|nr:HAMP domain-containing protein [Thermoanaerobaculia bacterium]
MLVADNQSKSQSRFGLREKFIAIFALQTIVIASVILLIERYAVKKAMTDQTVQQGSAIAETVESTAGYYVLFGLTDDLKSIIGDLVKNHAVEYADFVGADGKPLAASRPEPPPFLVNRKLVPEQRVDLGGGLHLFVMPFTENRADLNAHAKGYFRLVVNESQAQAAIASLKWWNIGVTILALMMAILAAYFGSRFIVRPILELVSSASRIAQGDLTQRTEVDRDDEIGNLFEAFNSMASNLERTVKSLMASQTKLKSVVETVGSRSRTVIDRVDEQRSIIDTTYISIDQLNSGVRKITDNVEALSASSEETSSSMLEMVASMEEVSRHTDTLWGSVEETASATHQMVTSINEVDQNVVYLTNFVTDTSSSMVEMSASIAQVETNAARSYDLAVTVADAAESGMKAVRETIEGMEQIRKSVHESNSVVSRLGERSVAIGKILNVIEDVAEQTNLLALNAAI